MKTDFVVWGKLAGWNDFSHKHHMEASIMKKKEMRRVQEAIMLERVRPFTAPIDIHITWIEPDYRRDPDNVCSGGFKIILDALVNSGIIPNDTRKWVKKVTNEFAEPCKKDPCVVITIETHQEGPKL